MFYVSAKDLGLVLKLRLFLFDKLDLLCLIPKEVMLTLIVEKLSIVGSLLSSLGIRVSFFKQGTSEIASYLNTF